jgi:hypothetical protein
MIAPESNMFYTFMKFRAKAIMQNVSARTDKGSVDYIDGFLDQMKRGSK